MSRIRKPKGQSKSKCSKCNNTLELNRLGKYRYCLSCHNNYMKQTRPKHSQLTDLQRLKANCRSYLNQYVKRGKILKPQICSIERCTNNDIEAHHNDYTKPLEVQWLCREHHISIYH